MFLISDILKLASIENSEFLMSILKNAPSYITDHSVVKNLYPDEILITAGQKADKVYLHISGLMEGVDTQKSDIIYHFAELNPVNFIGEFEAFSDKENYLINIHAKSEATLISIDSKDFLNWMKYDIEALNIVCRLLAHKLTDELKTNRDYLFLSSYDRLLLYFYHSANKNQGKRLVTIYKTQSELADQIGFSGKTINRTMNKLETEGFVISGRNTIKISPDQFLMLKCRLEELQLI